MRRVLTNLALVMVIVIAAIIGCLASFSSVRARAAVAQTLEGRQTEAKAGMDYLANLRLEGHLPGLATNEHGNACISGELACYPYSLTMCLNKEGEASTNHYNIVQIRKGSPWQLKRAWRTDANDQILQEWSVN